MLRGFITAPSPLSRTEQVLRCLQVTLVVVADFGNDVAVAVVVNMSGSDYQVSLHEPILLVWVYPSDLSGDATVAV